MARDDDLRRRRYQRQQLDRMRRRPHDPAFQRARAEQRRRSQVIELTQRLARGDGDRPPAA